MDPKLLLKLLEAVDDRYGKPIPPKAMDEVWEDCLKVPGGAFAPARQRLLTECERLPTAATFLKILKEEGKKCKQRDYVLRRKAEGKVQRTRRGELLSEEEMDLYVKRSGEVARYQLKPVEARNQDKLTELVEAMVRDYPGRGWEEFF